jgi:hypothetical protein
MCWGVSRRRRPHRAHGQAAQRSGWRYEPKLDGSPDTQMCLSCVVALMSFRFRSGARRWFAGPHGELVPRTYSGVRGIPGERPRQAPQRGACRGYLPPSDELSAHEQPPGTLDATAAGARSGEGQVDQLAAASGPGQGRRPSVLQTRGRRGRQLITRPDLSGRSLYSVQARCQLGSINRSGHARRTRQRPRGFFRASAESFIG